MIVHTYVFGRRRTAKSLTIVLAFVLVARAASAQVTLGLVAGGTSATTSDFGMGRTPVSSVTGFAGGLSLTVPLSHHISLAPEILFAMKGTTDKLFLLSSNGPVPNVSGTSNINYIEVPVLVRLSFGSGALRPFVTAGPEIAFKVACNFTVSGPATNLNGESACSQATLTAESGVKSTDLGAMVGAGLSSGRLSVSVRYDVGLSNWSLDTYGAWAKNRAIMAVVGVTP
jgi:hypothetical protein